MSRQLNIFIAGGYDPEDPENAEKTPQQFAAFGGQLGKEVVKQGHLLLNGCMTAFDGDVARGAFKYLEGERAERMEIARKIRCYVPEGKRPVHDHGTVMESELTSWDLGRRSLTAPEVVRYADAVILLGGYDGTYKAANWARVEGKPILAFATFGGAAEEIHEDESKHVSKAGDSAMFEYESVTKSLSEDWVDLASRTVELAEKFATSNNVFVVMSFAEAAEFDNVHKCFKTICEEYEYVAQRVDESNRFNRILPEIMNQIRQCAFVIADVSTPSPNVFYEVGFAEGAGKQIIFTAKKGTPLPFDVRDAPVIFYDSFPALKELLRPSIAEISKTQGRSR